MESASIIFLQRRLQRHAPQALAVFAPMVVPLREISPCPLFPCIPAGADPICGVLPIDGINYRLTDLLPNESTAKHGLL